MVVVLASETVGDDGDEVVTSGAVYRQIFVEPYAHAQSRVEHNERHCHQRQQSQKD